MDILKAKNSLIYDLGMHNGQDTDFYLKKGFDVVAIEANPMLCEDAKNRFRSYISSGQLTIINKAISDKSEQLDFYVNKTNTKWSSLYSVWGNRGKGSDIIKVDTVPLQDVIASYGLPYYMKIDIEGADMTALKSLSKLPNIPNFVSVEGGGPDMLNLMAEMGYGKFAVVNQKYIPDIRLPEPALEGKFVDYTFEMGASGLFGEEIQEEWIALADAIENRLRLQETLKEIANKYPNSPSQQRQARDRLGWFDVHARIA